MGMTRSRYKGLRMLTMVVVSLAVVSVARADLIASNAAGVRAGITGIIHDWSGNSIGVQFLVNAPTATNITTFTIQKSFDLKTWTDYSSSVIVTGSLPLTQMSDFVAASNAFYRMHLINF